MQFIDRIAQFDPEDRENAIQKLQDEVDELMITQNH